ncbi:helix-turn-helix domain-containing protein [Streptomyces sp. NPDC049879]|uniref:helix-turn-helix domain-containing protein n=1 Tax=Streptomyces sp. NPDC049879 TaxID=3365598 RepID=UPI0037B1E336
MSAGYRTPWTIPAAYRPDPAYVEAGAALALGQAVHDRRTALGLDHTTLAERTGLSPDDIERLEGGATPPTLPLLRTLSAALDAKLDMSVDPDDTYVSFIPHPA